MDSVSQCNKAEAVVAAAVVVAGEEAWVVRLSSWSSLAHQPRSMPCLAAVVDAPAEEEAVAEAAVDDVSFLEGNRVFPKAK